MPDEAEATAFSETLRSQSELPEELYSLFSLMPKGTVVMDALRTAISFLAGYEDTATLDDTTRPANLRKGMSLTAKLPAVTVNAYRALNDLPFVKPDPGLGYSENFLYMIKGERPDKDSLDAFDRVLICYVEHELPNSTFVARAIASTLSDVYGAAAGATASLKGPLHGGANEAVLRMLLEILDQGGASRTEPYVMEKLEQRQRIMGFGHRVYMRKYDPRALFLRDYISSLESLRPEGKEMHDIYRKVEEVMAREKSIYPNMDYPVGLLFHLLGLPIDLYTPVFLCARMPGLVAHVIEQHEDNRLYRPRAVYRGASGLNPPDHPIGPA